MKEIFKKISAFLMAIVVLLSTMSFSINEHYCGDDLMDTAIFSKVESCGMDAHRAVHLKVSFDSDNNCCKDVVKLIEGQNELNTYSENLNFEQKVFIASFVYSYINLFEGLDENIVPFRNYSPPLVHKDLQILLQTFRI